MSDFTNSFFRRNNDSYGYAKQDYDTFKKNYDSFDFDAYLKQQREERERQEELRRLQEEQEKNSGFFKGGDSNFFVGALNSYIDFSADIGQGFFRTLEGVADFLQYSAADSQKMGSDLLKGVFGDNPVSDFYSGMSNWFKENAAFDSTGSLFGTNENAQETLFGNQWRKDINEKSYLGDMADSIGEGIGNIGAMAAMSAVGGEFLGAAGIGVTETGALTTGGKLLLSGGNSYMSAYGNSRSEAYKNGATDSEAQKYAFVNGLAEAISEQVFDSMPGISSAGFADKIGIKDFFANKIKSGLGTNTAKVFLKLTGGLEEGAEEMISNALVAVGQDLMHMADQSYNYGMENNTGNPLEDGWNALFSEDSIKSFTSAGLTSVLLGVGGNVMTTAQRNQVINAFAKDNGMSFKEAKSLLSGETLQKQQEQVQKDVTKGNIEAENDIDIEEKAKQRILNFMQTRTGQNVESYINDLVQAEEQRLGTEFTQEQRTKLVDEIRQDLIDRTNNPEKYRAFRQQTNNDRDSELAKSMAESGLKDTKLNHQMYDFVKKLQDANKDSKYKFVSPQQLVETGILEEKDGKYGKTAIVDGKEVFNAGVVPRGFKLGDTIYINSQLSQKGLDTNEQVLKFYESIIGHEMGEAIKASDKQAYDELKTMVKELYDFKESDLDTYKAMYGENLTDNVEDEYVNDKLGELFENDKMLDRIADNRTLLQKVIDEIKKFIKYMTSGKEQKQMMQLQQKLENKYAELYKQADFKSEVDESLPFYEEEKPKFSISDSQNERIANLQEEYDSIDKARDEVFDLRDNLRNELNTLIRSDDYKQAQSKFMEMIKSGMSPDEIQKTNEYQVMQQEQEIRNKLKDYDMEVKVATDDMTRISEMIEQEEKSHRNPKEAIKKAKKIFGTTQDYREAAYLLQDGSMLDFSGRNQGSNYVGKRGLDHREINEVGYDMDEFIELGNIRMKPEAPGFELNKEPTEKQYSKLYDYIEYLKEQEPIPADNSYIDVDIETKGTARYETIEYKLKTPTRKIINDIKEYYETGNLPQQSEYSTFYSLSETTDSQGNNLTKQQRDYFKDSKVRDAEGRLIPMYHGTPTGTTTEFRPGTYFTSNKQYADTYQNPGASSISSADRKVIDNPRTYQVYLDIKNPFDISNPEIRDIFINEYVKGGYALGINPYLSDTEYDKIQTIDWTEGENLQEFLEEEHPEFDGLVLNEGGIPLGNGEVLDRGTSYVVMSPEQVKNIDNSNPTSSPDIRYSLSVEQANTGTDNTGRELSEGQKEYFKNSKVTDENGNLIKIYHTTTDRTAQFNEFNPVGSQGYRYGNQVVNFFTDSKEMSGSYADQDYKMANTKPIKSMSDVNDVLNEYNSQGFNEFKVEEKNGKYVLTDNYNNNVINKYNELTADLTDGQKEFLNNFLKSPKVDIIYYYTDYIKDIGLDEALKQSKELDLTQETLNKLNNIKKELDDSYLDRKKIGGGGFVGYDVDNIQPGLDLIKNYIDGQTIESNNIYTFNSEKELYNNLINTIENNVDRFKTNLQYEGYANITNPYIVDAKGKQWNSIEVDNLQDLKNEIKEKWDIPERQLDRLEGNTLNELNKDLTKLGYQLMLDEYGDLGLFTKEGQLAIDMVNVNDVMQEIRADLDNDLNTPISTNDIVFQALAENKLGANYDGVIIKNTIDYGGAAENTDTPNNIYVTFKPNQFKAANNVSPTQDTDIRYSLSTNEDTELNELSPGQMDYFKDTKAVDRNGNLEIVYHGTPHDFTIFDISKAGETGVAFGTGFYFTNSKGAARGYTEGGLYGDTDEQIKEGYVDIKKPASRDTKTMTFDEFKKLYDALNNDKDMYLEDMEMSAIDALLSDYGDIYNDKQNVLRKFYDSYETDADLIEQLSYMDNKTEMYKVLRDTTGFDGLIVDNPTGYDAFEKYFIAFNPDQFKLESNKNPTNNVDMTLSLYQQEQGQPTLLDTAPSTYQDRYNLPATEIEKTSAVDRIDDVMAERRRKLTDKRIKDMIEKQTFKSVKAATKIAKDYLGFDTKETQTFRDGIQKLASKRKDALIKAENYQQVKDLVSQFANRDNTFVSEELKEAQKDVRHTQLIVSDDLKNQITDWSDFRRRSGLNIKKGQKSNVDVVYQELCESYPGMFNESITNYADQLEAMSEFVHRDNKLVEHYTLDERILDNITNRVWEKLSQNALTKQDFKEIEDTINKQTERRTREVVQNALLEDMGITLDDIDVGKDISSIAYQRTDPKRLNEKVFGYDVGTKINDATTNFVGHQEAERTRFVNKEKQEIADLGIKARSKMSAAVQKYGEKQYLNDKGDVVEYNDQTLMSEFPKYADQQRIKRAAQVLRQKYDSYIDKINESLVEMGYDPIPKRQDYFKHFLELEDKFSQWGIPYSRENLNAEELSTDINGLTDQFKPGKNFFASAMERKGMKTNYDAITGIDKYLDGASNLMYHTESIQRYRTLSKFIRNTYGQTHGLENIDSMTEEQAAKRLEDVYGNKLTRYAAWLDEQANAIAGKKGAIDRAAERLMGRKAYTFLSALKSQVGSNMTGFNVRSAMTNFASAIQGAAKTEKLAMLEGNAFALRNYIHENSDLINKSDFLTKRFGTEQLSQKLWQKLSSAGQVFMNATDRFTSMQIWGGKYYEGLHHGLTENEAIKQADDFAARIMGDRSKGQTAEIFNSKTLGFLTQFQLEVNNQWSNMIHDNKMEMEKNPGAKTAIKIVSQLGQLYAASYFFNSLMKALTGSDVMFDPIDILMGIFAPPDDDDKTLEERATEAVGKLIDQLPMASIFTGGRIPISEAFTGVGTLAKKLTGQKDDYGNDIEWGDVKDDLIASAFYYLLPTGYGQFKKTAQGLSQYGQILPEPIEEALNIYHNENLPMSGVVTKSGRFKYEADESTFGKIQSGLFGRNASANAREYREKGYQPLTEKAAREAYDANLPIAEYREVNKGISEAKKIAKENGESQSEAQYDYIYNLPISMEQKNSLINSKLGTSENVTDDNGFIKYTDGSKTYWYDSQNDIVYNSKYREMSNIDIDDLTKYSNKKDITNYGDYGSLEEFNYANNNPSKYKVIQQITDYNSFKKYKDDLTAIKDNYNDGTKAGQNKAKQEVFNYINGLELNVIQKLMLQKMAGGYSINNYKSQIRNYIQNLNMTAEEKKELDDELF